MCDCDGGEPTTITDWANGDVVCCMCGVVVEGHILDETPEWRNHGGEGQSIGGGGGGGGDQSRVGAPGQQNMGTYLEHPPNGTTKRKRRRVFSCPDGDAKGQALREGIRLVDGFVSSFGLSTSGNVAAMARELFGDLHEAKPVRSDTRHAAAAAAVYYGCKLENVGRELRLVSQVCGVDTRALNAATSEYKACLQAAPYYTRLFATLQAGKLIDMFLDRLRLPADQRKRVWRAAHQLDEALVDIMDCGRKPRTICSGILYVAVQQESITAVGKKEITEACAVCQQTLDKVVTQIRKMLLLADDTNKENVPCN